MIITKTSEEARKTIEKLYATAIKTDFQISYEKIHCVDLNYTITAENSR